MSAFTPLNMFIVGLVLVSVTLAGHLLTVKAKTSRGFFTAEGGLPWWAVSASLYATVVSAVSFISIPAMVYAPGGNLTFIQLLFGLAIGKLITALLFVKPYYESRSIETVYDYLDVRIGGDVAKSTMGLQILLLLMDNSIVVMSAALVLNVLTDISLPISCLIIVSFAVLWSWMGGLSTVVWTDAMLFGVFILGAVVSVATTYVLTDLSPAQAIQILNAEAKLKIIEISLDPQKSITLFTGLITGALIAMVPITSQAGMQRIRACRSARDAQKAFIFSVVFYITPLLLLAVGLGLSLFYNVNGVPEELASRLQTQPDQVFPFFMLAEIPDGVSGIFIAAVFAAAISTLDSRLAELSDITVTNVYKQYVNKTASEQHYLHMARMLILGWGLLFCATSVLLSSIDGQSMLDLTLMAANTFGGPILGIFLLARFNLGTRRNVAIGVVASVLIALTLRNLGVTHYWWFPISILLMLAIGWITRRKHFDRSGVINTPLSPTE